MSGNYTGNEQSRAVKLRAAVLGVADIVCARNTHFNFPTSSSSVNWVAGPDSLGQVFTNFGPPEVAETSLDPTDQRDNVSHFTDAHGIFISLPDSPRCLGLQYLFRDIFLVLHPVRTERRYCPIPSFLSFLSAFLQ